MIKDFLIITSQAKIFNWLRLNNNFFIKKLQTNIKNNDKLVGSLIDFTKEKKAIIDNKFSILVNIGSR